MRRNSCRDRWITIVNARVSKVFGTGRGQSLEVIADLFNVLNFFDRDWGVRRTQNGTRLLAREGYDAANGRLIYDVLPAPGTVRDVEATRWRMQLGARYTF